MPPGWRKPPVCLPPSAGESIRIWAGWQSTTGENVSLEKTGVRGLFASRQRLRLRQDPPRLRGLALHPGDPLRPAAAPGPPPHGAGDAGLPEERLARRRHREDEMSGLQQDLEAGTATIGSIPWQKGNDSPTKLDKIKSLRVEVQAITLAGADDVSYTPRMLGVDRSIACGLAKGLITFLPAPATHQFPTRYTGRRTAQSQPRPWRLREHRDA